MQLISREHLFELGRNSQLNEAENQKFNYEKFKIEWQEIKDTIKNTQPDINEDTLILKTYTKIISKWVQTKRKDIKFVGRGSSRAAFALVGGKCLKLAKYKKGLAQNFQEVKNYDKAKNHDLKCFTQIHGYDSSSYGSIFVECCAKAKQTDFHRLYNLSFIFVIDQLNIFKKDDYDSRKYRSVKDLIEDMIDFNSRDYVISRFWKNCLNGKGPQWDVMRDLLTFYFNGNRTELVIDDLAGIDNWGVVWKEDGNKSTLVPIILDYGLSDSVYNTEYKKRQ